MSKIYLNDLLKIEPSEFSNIRVKFNQHNGTDDPMDLYLKNPDIVNTRWFLWRSQKKYFKVGQIAICLLKLTSDRWLLTTVKKITIINFWVSLKLPILKKRKHHTEKLTMLKHSI